MRGKRGLVRNYKGKEADEQKVDVVPVDIYEIKKNVVHDGGGSL